MVYLDADFMAHAEQDTGATRMPWMDADGFFTGKCAKFIEGYRVIPAGEIWERDDGELFNGLMISPAMNPAELVSLQAEYDRLTIADLDAAVVDLTYQSILLELGV